MQKKTTEDSRSPGRAENCTSSAADRPRRSTDTTRDSSHAYLCDLCEVFGKTKKTALDQHDFVDEAAEEDVLPPIEMALSTFDYNPPTRSGYPCCASAEIKSSRKKLDVFYTPGLVSETTK